MNKYLEMLRTCDRSAKSDQSPPSVASVASVASATPPRLDPYGATLAALEGRIPDRIDRADWEIAVTDARRFLAQWGEQAKALRPASCSSPASSANRSAWRRTTDRFLRCGMESVQVAI
jgi:hypothetical protein